MANYFQNWKAISNFLFDKIGTRSFLHYNFKPSRILHKKLVYVSEKQPSCISEIVGQCVWKNTYILKQGSTLSYTRLYNRGIIIINDLIDSGGNLMDWSSAKLKFELADQDMMSWLSIVQAIPSTLKKQIINHHKRINNKTPSRCCNTKYED